MARHTPGPWEVEGNRVMARGLPIATAARIRDQVIEEANLCLIAGAPDLLSIVKRFVALPCGAWHPERHAAEEAGLMADARDVIAKAEGR